MHQVRPWPKSEHRIARGVSAKGPLITRKRKTQRKREKHFKRVSRNDAFCETVCENLLYFRVFGRIVLQNGSAPFLSSYLLPLRFGLLNNTSKHDKFDTFRLVFL